MSNAFSIREAEPGDISYIYKTWLASYRYYSLLGKSCRNAVFFDNYRLVIDRILGRDTTKVLVTCSTEVPSTIFCYLAFEPGVLHYIFTKGGFHGEGLARNLFYAAFPDPDWPIQYTHKTITIDPILQGKDDKFIFNPFLLYDLKGAT